MITFCDYPEHAVKKSGPQVTWEQPYRSGSIAAAALDRQLSIARFVVGNRELEAAFIQKAVAGSEFASDLEGSVDLLFTEPEFRTQGSFVARLTPATLPDLDLGF
jgi:hypothetical protein